MRYPKRKDVSNHERISQSCCFATSTEANQFWALQSLKTPFINYCQLYLHFHLVHVPFFFPSISPFTLVVCACWSVCGCWSDLKLIPSLIYIHLQQISIYTSLSSHPDLVLDLLFSGPEKMGDLLHPPGMASWPWPPGTAIVARSPSPRLGFCILILLAGSCDIEIPVGLLCFLVGLCGIASGVMQSGPRRFELVDAFLGHFEREVYCPVCGELSGSMKLGIKLHSYSRFQRTSATNSSIYAQTSSLAAIK